jgi:16S rRNA (cytosine967-C5)-methyltransferase
MIAPARVAAYEILTSISKGRGLPAALAASRRRLRDDRDRALAAEIATGVQRRRAALDHLLAWSSKRTVDRLDAPILDILRLSAYQLLYLSRVPASAVVDDAVELARRSGKRSATGFVNAVLRTLSRHRLDPPLPSRPDDPGDREAALVYFSVTLSHPRWLAARWYDRFGFHAAEAWLRHNNAPAPITLRVNRIRTSPEAVTRLLAAAGVRVSRGRFAPDALLVEEGNPWRAGLDEGLFVVQDEASQLVAELAASAPGTRVLDACASPGGKTSAVAATMNCRGLLVAMDIRLRRIDLLRQTVAATRAGNVRIVRADLMQALPFRAGFDCVLVDAPCSGLGTLRRDPDIRWRRQEHDLRAFAAAELTMLRRAADVVRPSGRLIYATCSSEPDENEEVVRAFLDSTPGFAPVDATAAAPDLPRDVVDSQGYLRTEPHRHGLEAFFGAVLRRTDGV